MNRSNRALLITLYKERFPSPVFPIVCALFAQNTGLYPHHSQSGTSPIPHRIRLPLVAGHWPLLASPATLFVFNPVGGSAWPQCNAHSSAFSTNPAFLTSPSASPRSKSKFFPLGAPQNFSATPAFPSKTSPNLPAGRKCSAAASKRFILKFMVDFYIVAIFPRTKSKPPNTASRPSI